MYFEFGDVITFLLFVGGGIGLIWYSKTVYVEKTRNEEIQWRINDIRKRFGKEFSYPIEQYRTDDALNLVMQTDAWKKLKDEKKDGLITACVRLQDEYADFEADKTMQSVLVVSGWGLILFWVVIFTGLL